MAVDGTLTEGTNVQAIGDTAWMRVRNVPVLLALLQTQDLPDDEDDTSALPDDE